MQLKIMQCLLITILMCGIHAFNNFADIACGKQKGRRFGKIVGGQEAVKGEFPWLVSITRRGGHFCGGTIIHKRFVLTAGHCLCTGTGSKDFYKPSALKITLAQHDLSNKDTDAYQTGLKAISIHSGYSCNKPRDDIAILELEKPLIWSLTVSPACLPDGLNGQNYDNFNNALATVAGWGWTNEDSSKGGRANKLQKAKVNVIPNEKCKEWFLSQGKKTKIQNKQMCAGHEQGGVDACWADSGGPLMLDTFDETMVIGVVSTGIGCARPYLPGIYTRVSEYIPWIEEIVGSAK
ncbi:plasminogen-like [Aethina tumida]|uniref:plasminogen-like n=1 Tax=Aethina tumida TaxID=116153 RepID=UPI002147D5F6|nr:plasminogen-like [Aethina tumida]